MTSTFPFMEGAFFHIYNRGNNRENIFIEERNYGYFLRLWKKHIESAVEIYCYVLLKNHFHFLIRIKEDLNLSRKPTDKSLMPKAEQSFANFFNAYARAFNISTHRTGKLFQERFKRKPILDASYLIQTVYYIHTNPQKHGFTYDFRVYPHSSYKSFIAAIPSLLYRDDVIKWFGGIENFVKYHEMKHQILIKIENLD